MLWHVFVCCRASPVDSKLADRSRVLPTEPRCHVVLTGEPPVAYAHQLDELAAGGRLDDRVPVHAEVLRQVGQPDHLGDAHGCHPPSA